MNSSTEILPLEAALIYKPTWISTDRREQDPSKTTLKFAQVGGPTKDDKIGNAYGPIYMVEFVDVSGGAFIKIVGIDNNDDGTDCPIYPVAYLKDNPKLEVWLSRFEFCTADGTLAAPPTNYTVYGHRKRQYPAIF